MNTTDTPLLDAARRLHDIRDRMAKAARLADRKPEDTRLIAVSKTFGPEAIEPLLQAGQRLFGENRVQEAQGKWPALREAYPDIELHLVGQLQSNKAEDAVALFDVIHSLDRSSLAQALAKVMAKLGRRPSCYVQVNIGQEEQKGGIAIEALPALLDEAQALGLPVVGLMCVPPAEREPAPYFALLSKLAKRHGLPRLSMGMSGDFETAITLGATEIRVGTALFGGR
ncbi:YggS family pyridoxal phosphate-dependent enzyme [Pedomonas mirosovicensis]|uniref:YggS family pyridoxal phosphate-dependent enzyme n=1 Tax=Pedomonas mirosovicensis TaxID=2908641 RepID=UPI0021690A05|nr:YggS family pyridoxal phosphate-dependent enzyme [Pedomonas mirosovicensis]MCH8684122.1 YggS family pyridoxal phosphate-dependent enzyme [Pedomonas mirosovicensis]